MTNQLPLLAATDGQLALQDQKSFPGGASAAQGEGASFINILQALAGKDGRNGALADALEKLFPGLLIQGGRGLPPSLPQALGRMLTLLQSGTGTVKLEAKIGSILKDGKMPDGQPLSPEMVDLLKALLGIGGQATAAPKTADSALTDGQSAGPPRSVAAVPPGDAAPTPDAAVPGDAGHDAGTAAPGKTAPFPISHDHGHEEQSIPPEPANVRQFAQAVQAGNPGGAQAPPLSPPSEASTANSNADAKTPVEQIVGRGISPQALASLVQTLVTADARGGKGSPGNNGPGVSSATAPSPSLFSALYTNLAAPGQTASSSPTPMSLPQPFNQAGWDQALAHNVLWMVKNDVQVASLRLNPPHLGPIEVRVSFDQDQASVSFLAHHAAVRDALESALPRLRQMFGDGGINLANVDVSGHSATGQQTAGSGRQGATTGGRHPTLAAHGPLEVSGEPLATGTPLPLGLVDYFA